MIYITESKPRKMTGCSSFMIKFDFNQAVVDSLKALPTYYYHRADYAWEVPLNCLSQVLESLTFIDDIHLALLSAEESEPKQIDFKLTKAEIDQLRFKPFDHQIDGIKLGLDPKHNK